ncbi:MAG: hypothetical protein HC818_06130 [Synechococcaceae cyanobacterium RM1_1_27]|nr:hypothetical protein [Synechococcaceae cyanobacterium SM2_3_2]NJO86173.1 hypothetical protein [Synechococcaceae cyanobacterium RM1_1_27]
MLNPPLIGIPLGGLLPPVPIPAVGKIVKIARTTPAVDIPAPMRMPPTVAQEPEVGLLEVDSGAAVELVEDPSAISYRPT